VDMNYVPLWDIPDLGNAGHLGGDKQSKSFERGPSEMTSQTSVAEDLDRFRGLLRILAAGVVAGGPVTAAANADAVSTRVR